MAKLKPLNQFNEVEQFFEGVGIVLGAFIIVRFAGGFLGRHIASKGPKFVAKKIAEHIVQDAVIGRVPILDMERKVNAKMVAGTIATAAWYLFGGMDTLKDMGRATIGVDTSPGGNRFGFDEITVEDDGQTWVVTSRTGQIQYATINGARVDP